MGTAMCGPKQVFMALCSLLQPLLLAPQFLLFVFLFLTHTRHRSGVTPSSSLKNHSWQS